MNRQYKLYIVKPEDVEKKEEEPKKVLEIPMLKEKPHKQPKFWDAGHLLGEIIQPDNITVDNLKKKDELCPKVWDENMQMHPEVREVLLKNAVEFAKFAKLEGAKFKDIILTGSLANYNWHEGSDLDVHILMDYSQISEDSEFVDDYFRTKKGLWGERMPVQVMGHDVELYVQDTNEPHTSTGVYSIWNDKWLTKPIKEMVAIDTKNVQKKAAEFMDKIDNLEDSIDDDEIGIESDKMMEKLRKYRKAGLDDSGEFSTENLVFKVLRNTGYLEKLSDMKYAGLQKNLTLEGMGVLSEGQYGDKLKQLFRNTTIAFGMAVAGLALNNVSDNALVNMGVEPVVVNKAKKYLDNISQEEFEQVLVKAKQYPDYIGKKLKELGNDDEIFN